MTGVPLNMLRSSDFVMVGFDLIEHLDSLEAAVLLSRIAYRAGTEGGWWEVTKSEMQEECRLSEWKLDRALKELIDAGCVEWVRIRPDDNRRKVRPVVEGVGRIHPEGREETSSTPSSKKVITSPSTKVEVLQSTEGFEDWWNHYPKKVGKQAALRSYLKAVKVVDPVCVLAGLLAQEKFLSEQRTRGYCPDPATWLNAGRWDDEVTPRQEARPVAGSPEYYEWREQKPGEMHNQWQLRLNGGSWD